MHEASHNAFEDVHQLDDVDLLDSLSDVDYEIESPTPSQKSCYLTNPFKFDVMRTHCEQEISMEEQSLAEKDMYPKDTNNFSSLIDDEKMNDRVDQDQDAADEIMINEQSLVYSLGDQSNQDLIWRKWKGNAKNFLENEDYLKFE